MNSIAIHQPNFIPWLGFFYKISQVDTFVLLDSVQYSNTGMHDFHYIKTAQGRLRLKIPVKVSFGAEINQVLLNSDLNWKERQLKQIEQNYKKAPFFNVVFDDLCEIYAQNHTFLADFNSALIFRISQKFGLTTAFIKSSELTIETMDKNERIFRICKSLNSNLYVSGTGAAVYQNEADFQSNGIKLSYSTYHPFQYPQLWGNFESNVSVVDYLMQCGYDWQRVLENQK